MKFNYLFFGLLLLLFTSQAYAITDDLVSYYKLDESSDTIYDKVGSNNLSNSRGILYE